MKKNEKIVLDECENEFGITKKNVKESIREFYSEMSMQIDHDCMFREHILNYRMKALNEDVDVMNKTLILGNRGIEIVNDMLRAGYFEYDQLWHKGRYIEVSEGVRTYWYKVIEYITDAIRDSRFGDGDPVPESWIKLGNMINPRIIKMYLEE